MSSLEAYIRGRREYHPRPTSDDDVLWARHHRRLSLSARAHAGETGLEAEIRSAGGVVFPREDNEQGREGR